MNYLKNITVTEINHVSPIPFKKGTYPKTTNRPWHGIAFALDGELIYHCNGKDIVLDCKHVVHLPEHSDYYLECTKAGSFALINFKILENNISTDFKSIETSNINSYINIYKNMQRLFFSHAPEKNAELLSMFYKIISTMITDSNKNNAPHFLKRALDFIDNNIQNPDLTNEGVAHHLNISEVYLRKLFAHSMNISVKQYIQKLRIEKAKILLTSTTYSISETADACGYSGIYHFCRIFKQKTGYTPTSYRNENTPVL